MADEMVEEDLEELKDDVPIDRKQARISEIHNLIDQLPPINRNTLQYLCKFFNRVARKSNKNATERMRNRECAKSQKQ